MTTSQLGLTIRNRRRALRLGQEELAELAGVSARFVGELEHGKRSARLDKVQAVLDVLGLSMELKLRDEQQA